LSHKKESDCSENLKQAFIRPMENSSNNLKQKNARIKSHAGDGSQPNSATTLTQDNGRREGMIFLLQQRRLPL
jgi:hypothetical protein